MVMLLNYMFCEVIKKYRKERAIGEKKKKKKKKKKDPCRAGGKRVGE